MMSSSMGTVRSWVEERAPEAEIDQDTDLIETRIVDSMAFMEFLYVIEAASGQAVDLSTISADDLRTLANVESRFFSGSPGRTMRSCRSTTHEQER